ncbi:MAG: STAS domain-containing protein [Phycisphaerae bacterium]|nr:STAS domain-containing protein [Phycisphaerae bacterium]
MSTDRPLQIEVRREADVAVVKVSGSATMEATDDLRQCLAQTVEDPVRLTVLDLGDLDFVCSEGLGAIVAAYLKCARRGDTLRLAGPTDNIRELLNVTKLSKLFPVFPSVADAIQA